MPQLVELLALKENQLRVHLHPKRIPCTICSHPSGVINVKVSPWNGSWVGGKDDYLTICQNCASIIELPDDAYPDNNFPTWASKFDPRECNENTVFNYIDVHGILKPD